MSKKVMLICLGILLLFAMLAMAVAGKSRFPLVNSAVAAVMLPVENAVNTIGHTGDSVRGYWRALTVLQGENNQLKQDNIELRNANIQMASIYAENQQLRRLLEYKEENRSQKLVAAKVIGRNYGDLRDCFYIDAGEDKGLRHDMAVVNDGLVGVIDEVYADYSRVLMLTSPQFKVGARVLRADSRAIGIAGGLGSGGSLAFGARLSRSPACARAM